MTSRPARFTLLPCQQTIARTARALSSVVLGYWKIENGHIASLVQCFSCTDGKGEKKVQDPGFHATPRKEWVLTIGCKSITVLDIQYSICYILRGHDGSCQAPLDTHQSTNSEVECKLGLKYTLYQKSYEASIEHPRLTFSSRNKTWNTRTWAAWPKFATVNWLPTSSPNLICTRRAFTTSGTLESPWFVFWAKLWSWMLRGDCRVFLHLPQHKNFPSNWASSCQCAEYYCVQPENVRNLWNSYEHLQNLCDENINQVASPVGNSKHNGEATFNAEASALIVYPFHPFLTQQEVYTAVRMTSSLTWQCPSNPLFW